MKKLSMLAVIGTMSLVSVMSSCKKEAAVTPIPHYSYDNTDMKTMIKLSNKNLYERMYGGGKEPGTVVYIEHGFNMPPTFDDCQENPSAICGIVIIINGPDGPLTAVADSTGTPPPTYASSAVMNIDGIDYNFSAAHKGDAVLVMAKPDAPVAYDIKNVSITTVDGVGTKNISYEIYK